MHELSICQSLLDQVEQLAHQHQAQQVVKIVLHIGPLSGVEAPLLQHAYPLAAAGTVAEHAVLEIHTLPIKVHCKSCGQDSEASANRLLCAHCGDWHTQLISGDEMLLASLELDQKEDT